MSQQKKISQATFSSKLRILLDNKGRGSAADLAEAVGVNRAYVTQLKTGARTNPSMDVVAKIAEFFEVPVSWMLSGDNTEPPKVAYNREPKRTVHLPYDTDRHSTLISEDAPDATTDAATAAHSMTTADLVAALHDMIDGLANEKYSFLRPQRAATIRALLAELTKRE